jgi:hypothetical protein
MLDRSRLTGIVVPAVHFLSTCLVRERRDRLRLAFREAGAPVGPSGCGQRSRRSEAGLEPGLRQGEQHAHANYQTAGEVSRA